MKILSGILILVTVFLSIKHAWGGLTGKLTAQEADLMQQLAIGRAVMLGISVLSLVSGLMILFPHTFFAGNIINSAVILLIMALALKQGHLRIALMEIPFLLIPLVLIYLGHPFKK
jgi:hypothetical protein